MAVYRFARPDEENDILDFINLVFSQTYVPHHFDQLLPKVYAHPGFAQYHVVAEEKGKILSTIAMTELTMDLGADSLRAGYIGSVSVHERARGGGHMKQLMAMQIENAKEKQLDFMVLGGQRQRYGYWGFERAGVARSFSVNEANVRHGLKNVSDEAIRIREITENDDPALDAILALSNSQPVVFRRERGLLLDMLHSFKHRAMAIADQAGQFRGFFTFGDGTVDEMMLTDDALLPAVIKRLMRGQKALRITVPVYFPEQIRQLRSFAEIESIGPANMFKILNWPKVLSALLRFKQRWQGLHAGRWVFEIQGAGRFAISVQGMAIAVCPTDEAPEKSMDEREAVAFFFGPEPLEGKMPLFLREWLPLPLDIPGSHHF